MEIANLLWVPVFILLGYTLPACYLDIKQREMPVGFWTLLWVVCVPITIILYLAGIYPIEALWISLIATGLYFLLMVWNVYQGADFMFLAGISLFFITNPVSGHSLMQISYLIYLVASVCIFAVLYQTKLLDRWLASNNLPGFPMMLPISLALWLTVVLG